MVLEKIGNSLKTGMTRITNAIFIDKNLVDNVTKDIQRALIEADVNIELVLSLTQKIKKLAYDENIKGIDKKEQLIKLIHDEILQILGGKREELGLEENEKILFLGLYGSGKTTTISKLAAYYAKRGRKVACLGLDTERPAAMDQLEQMCKKAKVKSFTDKEEKDPKKIFTRFKKELDKYDLLLIDTAGRDGLKNDLVEQIEEIDKTVKAKKRILVMPADVGNTAKTQAEEFKKRLSINGVIITRMDGTAKGGGALTACAETDAPVYFIGTGEQIHEIERFDPESFINRLLGMGDISTLIEKVRSATDEDQTKKIEERLKEGKFTLLDLYSQLEQMNKIGSMDKLLSMVPGMGEATKKLPKEELDKQEKKMKRWKNAINSMTEEEIENPEKLEKESSRIKRIANGSATTTSEIRALLKQYKLLKDMIDSSSPEKMASGQIDKKTMQKLAKSMKGKMKF